MKTREDLLREYAAEYMNQTSIEIQGQHLPAFRNRILENNNAIRAGLLKEAVEALENLVCDKVEVEEKYKYGDAPFHPALRYKYERDMMPYLNAEQLLAKIKEAEETLG